MPGMFCNSVSAMNNSRSGALMPCARSTSTVRFEKPRPSNFWPRSMDLIQRSSALRERGNILTVAASCDVARPVAAQALASLVFGEASSSAAFYMH